MIWVAEKLLVLVVSQCVFHNIHVESLDGFPWSLFRNSVDFVYDGQYKRNSNLVHFFL